MAPATIALSADIAQFFESSTARNQENDQGSKHQEAEPAEHRHNVTKSLRRL